jgi:circadian clock protein KaiB
MPHRSKAPGESGSPDGRSQPPAEAAYSAETASDVPPPHDRSLDFEQAISEAARSRAADRYVLRLYVTGSTPRSTRAIANIRALCEKHLAGRYDLEVVDIYQQPVLAKGEQIIAAPTLVKKLPSPLRKVIGDLSNTEKVLMGLDIRPAAAS